MLRSNASRLQKLIRFVEILLAGSAFAFALRLSGDVSFQGASIERLLVLAFLGVAVWPVALDALELYESQRRTSLSRVLLRVVAAGVIATTTTTIAQVALQVPVPAGFGLVAGALQCAALACFRLVAHSLLRLARARGKNYRHVVVVGSGPRAHRVASLIEEHPSWGQRVIGLLDEFDQAVDPALQRYPIHKLHELPDLLRRVVVDEVVVACPRSMLPLVTPVVATCAAVGVPVILLSDVFGDLMPRPRVAEFGSHPALSFGVVHHSRSALWLKRLIDVVGASCLLLVASPVLALAALAIKLESRGPVLFRQKRCGLNGRVFDVLKLRSMYANAEQRRAELLELNEMDGPVFKIRNDPRVTHVGRWLRRLSVDELPQLWNVLRGEMSLVGPRPPIPGEVDQYDVGQRRRLSMRPGLTCLWQVQGRNQIGFDQWVQLDLEYIDRWSLALDASILLRTVPAVLKGTGAS
jgi:exopolysaccharide biosynthesis polyprenyl glycosylphosphotransferase